MEMELTDILLGAISLLLAILGFFLRQQIIVTKELTTSVNSLVKTVAVLENKSENVVKENLTTIKRLDAHAMRLDQHEKAIAIIEVKIDDIT